MLGMKIIGTGAYLPGKPITNADLARVMDTNDEWIRQRTGITQRHFCDPGEGPADLAVHASQRALDAAGIGAADIDYVLFSTMTPDHIFPGSGPLLTARLGCGTIPALDLRTQCAAFPFSLQVADGLLKSGAARRILIVGAEAHAGLMPWRDWDILRGERDGSPDKGAFAFATAHRGWSILFGDGAGALIVEASADPGPGLVAIDLHTDGRYAEQLYVPAGFKNQPYASPAQLEAGAFYPSMDGREIFKHAVTKLPRSVRAVCAKADVALDDVDWFIAHQANARINDAICDRLKVDGRRVPSNIDRYGNTSGATIPILVDEMRRDGRLRDGQLACFLALGAGLHWGSALVRL
jgi:3-oxoacyl-[acyl-carrier-protein] synthase-3